MRGSVSAAARARAPKRESGEWLRNRPAQAYEDPSGPGQKILAEIFRERSRRYRRIQEGNPRTAGTPRPGIGSPLNRPPPGSEEAASPGEPCRPPVAGRPLSRAVD